MLFLAMQVRVMAACMESQIDKQEYTASAQSRGRKRQLVPTTQSIRCLCEIPDVSPFGDTRIIVPLTILLSKDFNLYFTDFFCTNSKNIHYVTLVATKHNSSADQFCRTKLKPLNWYTNPFLRIHMFQEHCTFFCCMEPRVELLYTENINLRSPFAEWQYQVRTLGAGYSTEGGLAKRPNCTICNL